jgi:hypothetical protein
MIEIEDVLFVGNELVEELLLDGLKALRAECRDESGPQARKRRHRAGETEGRKKRDLCTLTDPGRLRWKQRSARFGHEIIFHRGNTI